MSTDPAGIEDMAARHMRWKAEEREARKGREDAINIIDALYPTDSQWETTNAIGRQLLAQAKVNVAGWRDEPDAVLFEYARLCIEEGNRQTNAILRKPAFP